MKATPARQDQLDQAPQSPKREVQAAQSSQIAAIEMPGRRRKLCLEQKVCTICESLTCPVFLALRRGLGLIEH
jgi:hypothetical protein